AHVTLHVLEHDAVRPVRGGGGGQVGDRLVAAVAGLAKQQVQAAACAVCLADQPEQLAEPVGVVRIVDVGLHPAAQRPALQAAGVVGVAAAEAGQHGADDGGPDSQAGGGKRSG